MKFDTQPTLPGITDAPSELTVTGWQLGDTLAALQKQGAIVERLERVSGCNGTWTLRLFWPQTNVRKSPFEHHLQVAKETPVQNP